ncbi:McrB family protein [Flavobacterium covae]|uniref:McrB family protein n=1 Tax=Flavobacterium covae TaxID=2906076 RepID=UPI0035E3F5CE
MLKDYRLLATRLTETFKEIKHWPEVTFNKTDKEKLKLLSNVNFVNDHSIQINIEGGNHTVLPSQYILYSIYLKELALNVKEYIDILEQKKKILGSNNSLGKQINDKTLDYYDLPIDDYSKLIGPKIFTDESLNLGAKSIVNVKEGIHNIRGISDFFGSIILKPINIPNASSSILGKFIYNLCENKETYNYFEKRFINYLPYIFKSDVLKRFCYYLISFLYSYDNIKKIENLIQKNSDYNYSSIKEGEISLTTIFKTSKNLLNSENLMQGGSLRFFEEPIFYLNNEFYYFSTEWTGNGTGRLDFESLKSLIEKHYPEFKINNNNGIFSLESSVKKTTSIVSKIQSKNKIYYGAPGTGKSYKVDQKIQNLDPKFYERVTFHPEYDHTNFVGGYKPKSEKNEKDEDIITYQFVPQAFTNIYERAWNDTENQYYLVIEEINRGNCAEIFGDIFQLLDRNSNYTVSPSTELKEHLEKVLTNQDGINKGLRLPSNLTIYATMNTSDQSLFPMDSAFKRRWDWEYIPICYDDIPENESFGYKVIIDDNLSFKWIDFIRNVNTIIKTNANLGMDKCIGNYFIKPETKDISLNEFINKAIFYLWNDVFKDEDNADTIFEKTTSYEDFFPINSNGKNLVLKIIEKLNITIESK